MSSNNLDQKIEYIKYCYSNIEKIRTDNHQKASMLMVIVAFMLSACITFIKIIFDNHDGKWCIPDIIPVFLWAIVLAMLLYTVYQAVYSFEPLNKAKTNTNTKAFTTFIYIANMSKKDFEIRANQLDADEIFCQLVGGIYDLSEMTKKRYDELQNTYEKLRISIVFFIIAVVIDIAIKIFQ